jgi:hypothetical protein
METTSSILVAKTLCSPSRTVLSERATHSLHPPLEGQGNRMWRLFGRNAQDWNRKQIGDATFESRQPIGSTFRIQNFHMRLPCPPGEGEERKWRGSAHSESARISDSHFKQPALKKIKASPPLFSQGAGSAGHFHPLAHEGRAPSQNVRGAERRKARVTFQTPCGARPMTLGVRLAALHCGVFLRPRDRLLETDRGGHTERP